MPEILAKAPDALIKEAEEQLTSTWKKFEEIKNHNQIKVLDAFKKAQIQNSHFSWVTGYGYDDLGKDKLDELYSYYFNTEAAIVRPQIVSGTHAIATAVFGNLNPGDKFVSICGKPYDTLQTVFKKYTQRYNLTYSESPALDLSNFDQYLTQLDSYVDGKTKLVFIQRSRGYEWRDSLSLKQLEQLIKRAKELNPEVIVFVDNCYGEFTQKLEPTDLGADIIAGSLIKNPGGGIVAAGAYIAGKETLVAAAAEELTAPGIGAHGGCMFDQTRLYFQGFFMGPLVVCEALKAMSLAAKVFAEAGLETIPAFDAERNDVIQAIKFGQKDKLLDFCKQVQANSPTNSMFTPVPDDISGYDDQVIMAAGTFIEGSSIELSADGPLREPYIGYFQGSLSYAHSRYVIQKILEAL